MAIIGSIVIGMVAQTDRFLAPLAKAQKALQGFGSSFGKFMAGPVGRLESALGSVGRTVAGAFEGVDKAGDAADRIGTTTAALTELRYAAKMTGSETEALDAALLKFSANLGEAVSNDMSPAAQALKNIGLDPKQLASEDITKAFAEVSDGFNKIGTDAEKNDAAMAIFGKGGIQVANTLKAGGAAIRAAEAEFRGFGGAVTETQRQSIAGMMDTIDKAGSALAGLGTQVAVGVSPYIDAAINGFLEMAGAGSGMGDAVGNAMDWVVRSIARVADFVQGARNVFLLLAKTSNEVWVTIIDGAAWMARGLDYALKAVTGYTTGIGETLTTMSDGFRDASRDFQASIMKTIGDESWGDKFQKGADKAIKASKDTAKAAADANAKGQQQVTSKNKQAEEKAKKDMDERKKKAEEMFKEMQTPAEKYRDELNKIELMRSQGDISGETASRALAKIKKEIRGDEGGPQKFAGAMDAGSVEGRSAILQAISGRASKDDPTAKNTADMAATLKRIEEIQRRGIPANNQSETEFAMF